MYGLKQFLAIYQQEKTIVNNMDQIGMNFTKAQM